jgi:hypothetical protein
MDHKSFSTRLVLLLEIFLESFASPPALRKQKPRGDDVEKHPAFHFISLLSCFTVLEILQYWLEWLKIYRTVAWSLVNSGQRGTDRTRVQEHKFKLKMLRNENQTPGVLWAPAM